MKKRTRIQSKQSLQKLRAHLKRGGLIAYPTESCYGIGAIPTNRHALQQVLHLKKRPQHKGLIVIGDKLSRLQTLLFRLPENAQQQLSETWPAPKTFVLPARQKVLPQLRGQKRRKLAVRVPDHAVARELCEVAKMPLVSTSCNRSGSKPCRTEREVRRQFGKRVWIIGGRVGGRRSPSEIIDWESETKLR
ncbi:L-threonylcarbamoyladenylate synthase [Kingella negevensis]|uniref:L-threonylcarbamoyladenylate synthase n=1 Tax=Kingella negevensis TaxID=1522312 RepID=UPI002543C148|nr:L-threonylcarbamoyladenylate synthase [Kingella negevensis]WII93830.1 L-threonylcarbamoyladenylate synthase [Kingella negevensis]